MSTHVRYGARPCWRKIKATLATLWNVDLSSVLLTERFGVQQEGPNGPKIRPIDNFRANTANDHAISWESATNDREDVISEAILALQDMVRNSTRPDEAVLVGVEDYVGAFRTLAPAESQRWLMKMVVWDPENEAWKVCDLLALPFGAVGAVLAWWRTATALRTVARRVFQSAVFYYVDDTHQIEVHSTSKSGKETFREVMRLLGWELDSGSSTAMCDRVKSLGCELHITHDSVHWTLTEEKKQKWIAAIDDALTSNALTSGAAAKLHGRLSFGTARVWGRVGRAALRPICRRQRHTGDPQLSKELRRVLAWWKDYLSSSPRCSLQRCTSDSPDFVMYTDAEGNGHVGAVLIEVRSRRMWHIADTVPGDVRSRLKQRKAQINLYELCAVWVALATFEDLLVDRHLLAFVDNQAALNMLIKGSSPCEDASLILYDVWLRLAVAGVATHFEYVESKKNLADAPSRGDTTTITAMGSRACDPRWPGWPHIGMHEPRAEFTRKKMGRCVTHDIRDSWGSEEQVIYMST